MANKNYKTVNYSVEIQLERPPNDVFDHVIDLAKWWPEDFEGEGLRLNSEFVFRTGDGHYSKNKVVEFVPDEKVVWLATESLRKADNYDWTGTKFIFELFPKGGNTLLKFTYDGVVLEHESDRLAYICDLTVKELLHNFIINGKGKEISVQTTMDNRNFTTTIEVAQSPQTVFRCITRDVAKWWGGKDLDGKSIDLNDEFTINHPGAHYSKQKLVEVVPGEKIVWLVTDSTLYWLKRDQHEWTNTKMIFEITTKGDRTVIHFTHAGLVPEKECYAICEQGWTTVINDYLFHFITEGKAHF